MQSIPYQISVSTILFLNRENNLKGWEVLYDKYILVMDGLICTLTTDKSIADKIFISLFKRLKQQFFILKANVGLYANVPSYAYKNARKEFIKRGINYTEKLINGNSTHHLFCSQLITLKEVDEKPSISKNEVKQNLHKEFLIFRSKNKVNLPAQQQQHN